MRWLKWSGRNTLTEGEPGRDSRGGREAPRGEGGAEARRPPDPTRPRQPGQRGRWGRGQRPERPEAGEVGGQAGEGGLAPGSWPGRPPTGEGADWVRGQLLDWGWRGEGRLSLWWLGLGLQLVVPSTRGRPDLILLCLRCSHPPQQITRPGFRIQASSISCGLTRVSTHSSSQPWGLDGGGGWAENLTPLCRPPSPTHQRRGAGEAA